MLNITAIQMHVLREPIGPVRAFADMIIDDCFIVRNLVIKEDESGSHYVVMPNRKRKDGSWQDVAHPINEPTRVIIENKVLDEYERVLNELAEQDNLTVGPRTDLGQTNDY